VSAIWMPLYVADYLAGTTHLRAIESGAYMHLIMHYWVHGGLPADEHQLAQIAKLTAGEWRRHRATLAAFFTDGWRHKRIDAELEKSERMRMQRAVAGRHGGVKSGIARARNLGFALRESEAGANRERSGSFTESEAATKQKPIDS
jgi:uncharacterized protein YdaU (DUF1376 family)